MKQFLLFLILAIGISGFGQLPIKLKYDHVSYSFDSVTVLITSGKMMSVYDQVNGAYLIPPTKNRLINFPRSNQYAEIPLKGGPICIHAMYMQHAFSVCGSDSLCSLGFARPESASYIVNANGNAYDSKGKKSTGQKIDAGFDWGTCTVLKRGNFYLISNYQKDYYTTGYPGERNYVPAFSKTGVYGLAENKWVIEPTYEAYWPVNDVIFFLRAMEQEKGFNDPGEIAEIPYNYVYDVFEIAPTKIIPYASISSSVSEDTLAGFLNLDAVRQTDTSTYYVTEKDGKMGFIHFRLFMDSESKKPAFEFKKLLEPSADFVLYQPYYQKLVVIFSDSVDAICMYDLDTEKAKLTCIGKDSDLLRYHTWTNSNNNGRFLTEGLVNSSQHFNINHDLLNRILLEKTDQNPNDFSSNFGISKVNDSLINVLNFYFGGDLVAFKSKIYPDEDSITADGYIPYYHVPSPFGKSGIYNLKSKNWVLQPEYERIFAGHDYFMCENQDATFSLYDTQGNPLFTSLSSRDAYRNTMYLKYIVPYKNVTEIFEAPNGFWHHTLYKDSLEWNDMWFHRDSPAYYVRSNDSLGFYRPDHEFRNTFPSALYEFVHYNPSLKVTCYLHGDSIHLESDFGSFSVPKKEGMLIYEQPDIMLDPLPSYQVLAIIGQDTTIYGKAQKDYTSLTTISLEVKNDLLVLNDQTSRVSRTCFGCSSCESCEERFRDYYDYELYFKSENSSVWKKSEHGWQKISPYYATIEGLKNGQFIVSTGYYFQSSVHDFPEYWQYEIADVKIDVPSRYMLLDSNLKAIPFLDYFDFPHIEDLGFGIKIKLDNGFYFFMTYDGVALTDAAWHDFEIENGKLKAILHTTYQLDDEGNQVLSEYGYPIELTSETVKYFKLP